MAQKHIHKKKAALFWALAQEQYQAKATAFLCMNLIMYAVGHLIEERLAEHGVHPSCPARGVPHADRGALLRRYLVGPAMLDDEDAQRYGELVAQRDTFIDGGIQDRKYIERYMALAQPLINRLTALAAT